MKVRILSFALGFSYPPVVLPIASAGFLLKGCFCEFYQPKG
jgi:hypothetical protein